LGTPAEVDIVCDEGNLSLKYKASGRETKLIMDRGDMSHLRPGDEVPIDFSFSAQFKEFISESGVTPTTLVEAIQRLYAASGWTTTNADGGGVFTFNLIFDIVSPVAAEKNERVTLTKCFDVDISFQEGDPNTLSMSGKAFMTRPTFAKVAKT
jgi:hypothetical protein